MKTIYVLIYSLLLFFGLIMPTQAASFDCAKASAKVEKLICSDVELSKLDEELNEAYKTLQGVKKDTGEFRIDQGKWLSYRDGCDNSNCLILSYKKRIQFL